MFRNVKLVITNHSTDEALLVGPNLELIGLNTKEILAAVADRLLGNIYMSPALPESDCGGKNACLLLSTCTSVTVEETVHTKMPRMTGSTSSKRMHHRNKLLWKLCSWVL